MTKTTAKNASRRITDLERAVLRALTDSAMNNAGGEFGFIEDARSAVKSPRELSGIVSSLTKKGFITVWNGEGDKSVGQDLTQFTFKEPYDAQRVYDLLDFCDKHFPIAPAEAR